MRITRIENQKKHQNRKNIYADEEFLIGLSDETLIRSGIRVGDEVSAERLKALQRTEELVNAKRSALRFLSHRPRTVREVRDKLREKEVSDNDIAVTIDDLTRSGLLDDAEFARMYIRDALALHAVGQLLLRKKLLLFGIDRATVDEALHAAFEDENSEGAALAAARKYMQKPSRSRGKIDKPKLRNRVAAFLGRRGYTWDVIQSVLKKLFAETEPADNAS
jgi:regulatory protein